MLPTRFTTSTSLSANQVLDKMSSWDASSEVSGSLKRNILSRFRAVMYSSERPLKVTVDRTNQSFVLRDIIADNRLRVVCQGRIMERDKKSFIRGWVRYTAFGLCMSALVLMCVLLLTWKIVPALFTGSIFSSGGLVALLVLLLLWGFLLFNSWLIRKLATDQLRRLLRKG